VENAGDITHGKLSETIRLI